MTLADFIFQRRNSARAGQALEAEAADWLVQRHAGFTPVQAARFQEWVGRSDRHAAAVAKMEATWTQLDHPRMIGHAESLRGLLALRARKRTQRLLRATGAMASLTAIFIVLALTRSPPAAAPIVQYNTTIAQRPDVRELPDGSRLELKSGAEFETEFSETERRILLARGEAVFDVKHDAQRPFVVVSGGIRIRAVGTKFLVRHQAKQVDVIVTEGAVSLARERESQEPKTRLVIAAGKRARVPLRARNAESPLPAAADIQAVSPDDIHRELAWRSKRVEFTGTPLIEAVECFNRQNRTQIRLAEPSLRTRQVTGICWVDDPMGFARLLEVGLGIVIETDGETLVLR